MRFHLEEIVKAKPKKFPGFLVPNREPRMSQLLYIRSATVILPHLPSSIKSNWLQICRMSFSAIFPISLSLYMTNSDLLQGETNQLGGFMFTSTEIAELTRKVGKAS